MCVTTLAKEGTTAELFQTKNAEIKKEWQKAAAEFPNPMGDMIGMDNIKEDNV